MPIKNKHAPGWPGIAPRWTSSAKSGVGTATSAASRVWFTLSHGILNEVYYPTLDMAATRDLGLLVTGSNSFFSEEKRNTEHQIEPIEQGVPGYRITNTCKQGRYKIIKTIIADTRRETVLQNVKFEALQGDLSDYMLYALVAPHLQNSGWNNTGWSGDYKGLPMLFAQRNGHALALACSAGFKHRSCGYVGVSDDWQDLQQHHRMTWEYEQATNGNIALMGAVDISACQGSFTLSLAFGDDHFQAGLKARASLFGDFDDVAQRYISGWQKFHDRCEAVSCPSVNGFDLYKVSTSVLKTHESKQFPGAMIASLSVPWGDSKGDDDLGGYHLVWPRDLVETASGLLASGDTETARQTLAYLMCTQEQDGHWPQNMWLSGEGYWQGIQTDETAFFILLADALRRRDALGNCNPYLAVRNAAGFLLRNGPTTQQDRWEENAGFSPFTLAVVIAALLAAADFAELNLEKDIARYLRETADSWNENIESWTYVTDTPLAREHGVEGYYVRIAPVDFVAGDNLADATIELKNRALNASHYHASDIISIDALALVRFGLRSAQDPKIINTVKIIDALLKTDTATGPGWHRYTADGYGEHEDGSAFDGTGVGRIWPLLAGERAHYELAVGNRAYAEELLGVMAAQANEGGLLPEQIWDAEDITARELFNGRPSGSAMPLVWAHSECIKLIRSLQNDAVFDLPPQPVQRYLDNKKTVTAASSFWRFDYRLKQMPAGKNLRIELLASALVRWSVDDWASVQEMPTEFMGLGMHKADLPCFDALSASVIRFTFYWSEAGHWEGRDFKVTVQ